VQTIENNEPPETAGTCVRFFKRKTHPADLLAGKLSYTVCVCVLCVCVQGCCRMRCMCVCVCVYARALLQQQLQQQQLLLPA